MKCKDMKQALRKQQKEGFQQYHRIRELEKTQRELRDEIAKLKNVNASEIHWNHLMITVQTEVNPMICYICPDIREVELCVGSGIDTCIAVRRITMSVMDFVKQDRAAFIKGIGEQMAIAVLNAEATR